MQSAGKLVHIPTAFPKQYQGHAVYYENVGTKKRFYTGMKQLIGELDLNEFLEHEQKGTLQKFIENKFYGSPKRPRENNESDDDIPSKKQKTSHSSKSTGKEEASKEHTESTPLSSALNEIDKLKNQLTRASEVLDQTIRAEGTQTQAMKRDYTDKIDQVKDKVIAVEHQIQVFRKEFVERFQQVEQKLKAQETQLQTTKKEMVDRMQNVTDSLPPISRRCDTMERELTRLQNSKAGIKQLETVREQVKLLRLPREDKTRDIACLKFCVCTIILFITCVVLYLHSKYKLY